MLLRPSANNSHFSWALNLIQSNLTHGEKQTKKWLNGFVKNFARTPQGNDRAQILMVASGKAKLAVANSYYYYLMLINTINIISNVFRFILLDSIKS